MTKKYALALAYDGRNYSGWQIQNNTGSVQESLEIALSKIADEPISVFCAGRTDAGVHATAQIISFESNAERTLDQWLLGGNAKLPKDIRIQWIQETSQDFHARFNATERHYCYVIHNTQVAPCILRKLVTWHIKPLNAQAMHNAAQVLVGKHDFSSFRSSSCQAKTATRELKHISVERLTSNHSNVIILKITANAFLHHMVRNIVGSLLKIGEGTHDKQWLADVLKAQDRTQAGITAPADGLYLTGVNYPEKYNMPNEVIAPPII